ncbi:DUF1467 family protein [Erythrobacter sp. LQ02-29]|uniref:DUF1467 family protein n=1 Tax=Erythrobacter sp. LQ02-29 TaxID=2920384 RepID=UPI001F4F1095|nr:DUF1467 family protein [Erythrobacter sp. LQ02-29]MCP9223319.1 DUF1467 family protein [Erythrobacter sp. LQ02-29]
MAPFSIVAIYLIIWVFSAFFLLPFGVRTHDELGHDKIRGQADSAPANFRPWRLVIRASIIAAVLTALWVLNWNHGWISLDDINFIPIPEQFRDR